MITDFVRTQHIFARWRSTSAITRKKARGGGGTVNRLMATQLE